MLGFEKNNLKVSETKLKSVVNLAPNVKIQNKSKNIKTKPNVIIKLKNSSEQLIQCDSGRFNMPMLSSNLDFLSSFNSKN